MKPIQIYIGNDWTRDGAEMQKPNPDHYETSDSFYDALNAYADHVATLKTNKVTGPHSWKVGQRLQFEVDFWSDGKVVIPIEGEQEIQDGLYRFTKDQLYQIVSQAMTTALADDFLTPSEFIDKKVPGILHPQKIKK